MSVIFILKANNVEHIFDVNKYVFENKFNKKICKCDEKFELKAICYVLILTR